VGIKNQVTPEANRNVNTTANQPDPLGLAMPRDIRKVSKFICSQENHEFFG
jgi:hypothetical protein